MIWIIVLVWYATGLMSFIYWHTKNDDFTTDEILPCLIMAFLGPIVFYNGWRESTHFPPKILIRKRNQGDSK